MATTDTARAGALRIAADRREQAVAMGGIVAALAAVSCCIVPLALFSIGAGGVWIGRLTSLAPYQPVFLALAAGILGYGYWLVYRRRRAAACDPSAACARPLPGRIVEGTLWAATALVLAALAFPYAAPLLL